MAHKRLTFLLIIGLMSFALEAQKNKVADSLEHVLSLQSDKSERFKTLMSLSDELTNTDLPKSLKYGLSAYEQAEKRSNNRDKLTSSLLLARIYYFMSDLKKAMEYAMNAKSLAEDLNQDVDKARSLDAIGSIYYDIGNQARSSENFFNSLKIYEKLKDKEGIGSTFCRIGTLYLDQKDYDKAVDYYSKSIQLARDLNSLEGIASNLNNLAKVYCEKKEYAKALQNYKEALDINLKTGNSYLVGNNYLNLANVYVDQHQYPSAITKVEQARQIFDKLGNRLRLAKSQMVLGKIYMETDQLAKCEPLALNTLKIGREQGYNEIIVGAAGLLNKLYLIRKDSASAFRYFIIEKQYQDSLFQAEKLKSLSKLCPHTQNLKVNCAKNNNITIAIPFKIRFWVLFMLFKFIMLLGNFLFSLFVFLFIRYKRTKLHKLNLTFPIYYKYIGNDFIIYALTGIFSSYFLLIYLECLTKWQTKKVRKRE